MKITLLNYYKLDNSTFFQTASSFPFLLIHLHIYTYNKFHYHQRILFVLGVPAAEVGMPFDATSPTHFVDSVAVSALPVTLPVTLPLKTANIKM